jgi:hypothetical protein
MALDFPSNPQVDDEYQSGSTVWKWNGDAWVKIGTEGPAGPQGAQGPQGDQGDTGPTVYPAAGIAVSTGTAWDTSKTTPTGNVVGTSDTQTLTNKTFTGYKETVFSITDAATVTPTVSNGTIQFWTLGASRNLNTSGLNDGESLTLMIDDGTAYAVTWDTVKWVTNTAPTLATTGYTVVELWKANSNTYGAAVGDVP